MDRSVGADRNPEVPRAPRVIAVLSSIASASFIGLYMLEPELHPVDGSTAMVAAALYLQPALLMALPKRRASLDLAAGVIALILGLGPLLFPYALVIPGVAVGFVCSAIAGCLALGAGRRAGRDGWLAALAVILTVAALFAATLQTHPVCRAGPFVVFCEANAVSYVGAIAAVAALWAACGIVWLLARPRSMEPDAPVVL